MWIIYYQNHIKGSTEKNSKFLSLRTQKNYRWWKKRVSERIF